MLRYLKRLWADADHEKKMKGAVSPWLKEEILHFEGIFRRKQCKRKLATIKARKLRKEMNRRQRRVKKPLSVRRKRRQRGNGKQGRKAA